MTLLQVCAIVALAPLLHGALRRLRLRLQGRPGPPVLQPYRDLAKLWRKNAVLAEDAGPLATAAPGIALGVALAFAAAIPLAAPPAVLDAVVVVALLALGRWIFALAALDLRSGFTAMAASRETSLAALAEPALLLALLGARATAASLALPHGPLAPAGALALAALLVVMLAETARIPIDNQETHYELTMIDEGRALEYGGWQLALVQLAAQTRQLAFFALAAAIVSPSPLGIAAGIAALAVAVALLENAFARLRLFEIPQLLATGIVLAIASLGMRIA